MDCRFSALGFSFYYLNVVVCMGSVHKFIDQLPEFYWRPFSNVSVANSSVPFLLNMNHYLQENWQIAKKKKKGSYECQIGPGLWEDSECEGCILYTNQRWAQLGPRRVNCFKYGKLLIGPSSIFSTWMSHV